MAIRFYGATAEEQAELEKAAHEDEEAEIRGHLTHLDEKSGGVQQQEVVNKTA